MICATSPISWRFCGTVKSSPLFHIKLYLRDALLEHHPGHLDEVFHGLRRGEVERVEGNEDLDHLDEFFLLCKQSPDFCQFERTLEITSVRVWGSAKSLTLSLSLLDAEWRAPDGVTSKATQHCCEKNCHNIHTLSLKLGEEQLAICCFPTDCTRKI